MAGDVQRLTSPHIIVAEQYRTIAHNRAEGIPVLCDQLAVVLDIRGHGSRNVKAVSWHFFMESTGLQRRGAGAKHFRLILYAVMHLVEQDLRLK